MPSAAELWLQCLKGGSNTPAFDELPLSLLHGVTWGTWEILAGWLQGIFRGEPSYFLNGALHLCLRKKEPTWLLKNSRPIIVEPTLRRLAAGVMFRRVMCRAELQGWIDPWCYSYRKEFSPQYLAVFVRWALPYWVLVYSHVWVADWDESNAFCNV